METQSAGWGSLHTLVALLIAAAGEVIAILFVARVSTRRASPAATLTWIVVILAAPWLGLLLYYLLPRSLQMRRLRRRKERLAWIEDSLAELLAPPGPDAQHLGPLARLIERLDPDSLSAGNRLQLLETGAEFFAQAAEAIAKAQHFVHFEAYIFRPDHTGRMLLRLLTEAAARGVEVRLLYDALGSWSLKRRDLAGLVAAGGKAEPCIPLLWRRRPFTFNLRNHRKLLVVDCAVAFVGGRNVGDEYAQDRFGPKRQWLDAMLRLEGPAVPRLQRVFVEDWCNATHEDLARREYFPDVPACGTDRVGVVASGPDRQISGLYWVVFQLVGMAEKSIDISSPYLVPHQTLLTSLQVASGRGVRVRVHTNGPSAAHFVVYQAARSFYRDLLDAGIELHETQGDYNHAKMVIVDDVRVFVGSPNLDMRSTDLNFEIGVVTDSPRVAADAKAMFLARCAKGRAITLDSLSTSWPQRLLQGLARLVSPLL